MSKKSGTFQVRFEIQLLGTKKKKYIHGIMSGMCKKHAIEQSSIIVEKISNAFPTFVDFKLVKIKRLKTDFAVFPDENHGDLHNSEMRKSGPIATMSAFGRFLEAKAAAAKDYADGVAKAKEVNAKAKAEAETIKASPIAEAIEAMHKYAPKTYTNGTDQKTVE